MIRRLAVMACASWALVTVNCSGCRTDDAAPQSKPATPSAQATASTAPTASAAAASTAWPVPVGPALAILPGKGVGPIRFGATIATIERLMEFPCEIKTDTLCGYNGRAVDYVLSNGVVTEIRVHRVDRPDPNLAGAKYGVFNGRLLGGASPGMLQPAAVEILGAAQRVEQVAHGGPSGTVERHHYQNMIVEYDKLPNGDLVLGGIVLTAPAAASTGSAAPAK